MISLEVIQPIGSRIYSERLAMPSRKKKREVRDYGDKPTWGEVVKNST